MGTPLPDCDPELPPYLDKRGSSSQASTATSQETEPASSPPPEISGQADDQASDFNDEVQRLAALHPLEYDRLRKEKAKELGVRLATLDSQVEAIRRSIEAHKPDEGQADLNTPEPWHEPVDGAELLDEIVDHVRRHCIVEDHVPEIAALWVLMAWTFEHAAFAPILAITSPEPQCGKTTLKKLVGYLCPRVVDASNITGPALFRTVEAWKPTLLIDEADTFLDNNEDLRGIINSGHERDGMVVRLEKVGEEYLPRTFSTFCPKVIARIGKLHPTLVDRSILIRMRRKLRTEATEPLRGAGIRRQFSVVRAKCCRWSGDHGEHLVDMPVETPVELGDRAADNWSHLLAIAKAVGGIWTEKAEAAAVALLGTDPKAELSPSIMMLEDLRDLFEERRASRLPTSVIVEHLNQMDERPWPTWRHGQPLNAGSLARILKDHGIKPVKWKSGNRDERGYIRADLEDAWARYLPPASPESPPLPPRPPLNEAETGPSAAAAAGAAGFGSPSGEESDDEEVIL